MNFIIKAALDWAYGKLASVIGALIARIMRREQVAKEEAASVEPLKQAQTAEEIDAATKAALNNL